MGSPLWLVIKTIGQPSPGWNVCNFNHTLLLVVEPPISQPPASCKLNRREIERERENKSMFCNENSLDKKWGTRVPSDNNSSHGILMRQLFLRQPICSLPHSSWVLNNTTTWLFPATGVLACLSMEDKILWTHEILLKVLHLFFWWFFGATRIPLG